MPEITCSLLRLVRVPEYSLGTWLSNISQDQGCVLGSGRQKIQGKPATRVKCSEPEHGGRSVATCTPASSEAALVISGTPASSEAALVISGTPASSGAALVISGTPASSEAALVISGAPASSEAALVISGTPASSEAALVTSGTPASSEAALGYPGTLPQGCASNFGNSCSSYRGCAVISSALPPSEAESVVSGASSLSRRLHQLYLRARHFAGQPH
ncbi:uncharacterized protein [Macrobrachium rosenbergii]|uniref:uncharacterized protein n=1 Tax=Macrobrachium rosenbergii TaxID=79674 RepID=UPI0034D79BB2